MTDQTVNYLIIVGPQGAGKGTQAAAVAPELSLEHVATGDLFRTILKSESELGDEVRKYYDQGALVPDELTIRVLFSHIERLQEEKPSLSGVLLDGFPRNAAQAASLDEALAERGESISAVVLIDVPKDELMKRLTGRLVCSSCGATFHREFNAPNKEGICDKCGGELFQRSDDTPEAVEKRLGIYYEQTEPILDHYREQGVLVAIDGNRDIDTVAQDILSSLKERVSN
ncbi:MAG: adenylate kinase [Sphaerobacteraceae bacterium]|nr:MAG: adenylate kinase [Sphaerobacteraceae bacterium]